MAITAFTSTAIIDATTIGTTVLTASTEGIAADAIGLGATDDVTFASIDAVNGDFSGTVTTDTINSVTGISLEIGGSSKLNVASNGITYAYQSIQPSSTAAATTLGVSPRRWGNVYSVDGSFSGSLVSEVSGSYKLYNLGSEGDADTEYLETSFQFGKPTIQSLATGTGVARDLRVGTRTGARLEVRPNSGQTFVYDGSGSSVIGVTSAGVSLTGGTVYPASNDTTDLGTTSLRWSNVVSVDGDFSGTMTLSNLPTSDPLVAGQLYTTTGGALKVSAG